MYPCAHNTVTKNYWQLPKQVEYYIYYCACVVYVCVTTGIPTLTCVSYWLNPLWRKWVFLSCHMKFINSCHWYILQTRILCGIVQWGVFRTYTCVHSRACAKALKIRLVMTWSYCYVIWNLSTLSPLVYSLSNYCKPNRVCSAHISVLTFRMDFACFIRAGAKALKIWLIVKVDIWTYAYDFTGAPTMSIGTRCGGSRENMVPRTARAVAFRAHSDV